MERSLAVVLYGPKCPVMACPWVSSSRFVRNFCGTIVRDLPCSISVGSMFITRVPLLSHIWSAYALYSLGVERLLCPLRFCMITFRVGLSSCSSFHVLWLSRAGISVVLSVILSLGLFLSCAYVFCHVFV